MIQASRDNNDHSPPPIELTTEKAEFQAKLAKMNMSAITEISRTKSVASARSIDYVGFANFPNQVFRRCIKNGFEFTLMVVGEFLLKSKIFDLWILGQSGLGKSTFLNTLFMAELHDLKSDRPMEIPTTVKIGSKTFKLAENDVRLKLSVVDTPGFGDLVDNSNWFILNWTWNKSNYLAGNPLWNSLMTVLRIIWRRRPKLRGQ